MKPEEVVNKVLQEMLNFVNSTADFMKGQIPDVIQQLLHWKLAVCLFWLVLSISSAIGGFLSYKTAVKADYDPSDFPGWWIVVGILTITSLVSFFPNALDTLQIVFAPKVYLIEYLMGMVKK